MVEKETMFEYGNLTEFEKNLFLEKQIADLVSISRKRGDLVHVLKKRVDELEALTDGTKFARRENGLKRENRSLRRKIDALNLKLSQATFKINNEIQRVSNIESVKFHAIEKQGNGNKFSSEEGEFWLHDNACLFDLDKMEVIAPTWLLNIKLKRELNEGYN